MCPFDRTIGQHLRVYLYSLLACAAGVEMLVLGLRFDSVAIDIGCLIAWAAAINITIRSYLILYAWFFGMRGHE